MTTALVRGQAPRTITAEMVRNMKPGSVIVDLAASGGGNCESTVPGEKIVTDNGVTIIGYTDLTSRMPAHTSQLYGTNIVNLLKLLTPGKDGRLLLDMDDIVQRSITVTADGETLWPPPPVQVSAAPKPAAAAVAPRRPPRRRSWPSGPSSSSSAGTRCSGWPPSRSALAITFSPPSFLGYFTVFVLAVFVGFYVITNVSASLHTPLMAQTNAISGIILVGALLQLGSTNIAGRRAGLRRRDRRLDQHLRWLRRRRPDDLHVPEGRLMRWTDTLILPDPGRVPDRRRAVHPVAGRAGASAQRQGGQHRRQDRHGHRAGRDRRRCRCWSRSRTPGSPPR